ncbi:MAG: hypothetical protein KatS3mg052_0799 [Candidatus Roseilinea sp.]|nr:MAG: hypothetical protein KatS3mg052_0799 [Candidatus Roseilinea sp.]
MMKRLLIVFVALCAVFFSPVTRHAWACSNVVGVDLCYGLVDKPKIFSDKDKMHRPSPGSKVVNYRLEQPQKPWEEIKSLADYYVADVLIMPRPVPPLGNATLDVYGKVAGGIIPILNYTTTLIAGYPCTGLHGPGGARPIRDPYHGLPAWEYENPCYVQQALDAAVAAVRFSWNIQPINEARALIRKEPALAKRLNAEALNTGYKWLPEREAHYPFSKNYLYPLYMIVSAHRGMNWLTPFHHPLYYQYANHLGFYYPPRDKAVFVFYVVSASIDDACIMTMRGVGCGNSRPFISSFPVWVSFNFSKGRWEATQYYENVQTFFYSELPKPSLYGLNDDVHMLSTYYPPFRLWVDEMVKARAEGRPVKPLPPLFGVRSALEFIPETLYAPTFSNVLSNDFKVDVKLFELKNIEFDENQIHNLYVSHINDRFQKALSNPEIVAEVGAQVRERLSYSPQYQLEQTRTMGARYMFIEQAIEGNGARLSLNWVNDYRTRTLYRLDVKDGRVDACHFYQRDAWMVQPQSLSYYPHIGTIQGLRGGLIRASRNSRGLFLNYITGLTQWDKGPERAESSLDLSGRRVSGTFEIRLPGNSRPWELSGIVKYQANHAFNAAPPVSSDEVMDKCAQAEREGVASALDFTRFVMGWGPENARLMHYKGHQIAWFVPSPYQDVIDQMKAGGVSGQYVQNGRIYVVDNTRPYDVYVSPWRLLDARSGDAVSGTLIELRYYLYRPDDSDFVPPMP